MLMVDGLMHVLVDVLVDVFAGVRVDIGVIRHVAMRVQDPFVEEPMDMSLRNILPI
ncbi:MAG: hypothetical protein WC382_04075 [Methanoregulaceae archaeon]|jgi:hypothetical protein